MAGVWGSSLAKNRTFEKSLLRLGTPCSPIPAEGEAGLQAAFPEAGGLLLGGR